MAWLTILTELLGGASILAGAFVVMASIPMATVLLVAMFSVHLRYGFSSIKLMAITPSGAKFDPPDTNAICSTSHVWPHWYSAALAHSPSTDSWRPGDGNNEEWLGRPTHAFKNASVATKRGAPFLTRSLRQGWAWHTLRITQLAEGNFRRVAPVPVDDSPHSKVSIKPPALCLETPPCPPLPAISSPRLQRRSIAEFLYGRRSPSSIPRQPIPWSAPH
jgi:hypothetical protein